jgi:hypothetical protein
MLILLILYVHHKLIISLNFNRIRVKIIKQCLCKICAIRSLKITQKNLLLLYKLYVFLNCDVLI